MAQVVSGNKVKLDNGQIINAQEGGWYDARRFIGGQLLNAGEYEPGKRVSNEVIAQTNPNNVAYVEQKRQEAQPAAPTVPYGTSTANPAQAASSSAGGGAGVNFTPAPTIDLPALYQRFYETSGISDLEKKLSGYTESYNTAQSAINDNPFLAEANRVGRVQKLSTDFDNRTANIRNDIATKKADIEMQLNLQTKQFDINSQTAQQELSKFQMLLESGALSGASGEDIANITRATGLSSTMISSAIQAANKKNVQTQVISFDDGVNQGYAVIDQQTGQILNQQVVAASAKAASGGGSGGGGGGAAYKPGSSAALATAIGEMSSAIQSKINSYGHIDPTNWNKALQAWMAAGFEKKTFIDNFGSYADPNRSDFSKAYGFTKK